MLLKLSTLCQVLLLGANLRLKLTNLLFFLRDHVLLLHRLEFLFINFGRESLDLRVALLNDLRKLIQLCSLLLDHLTTLAHLILQLIFEGPHQSAQHLVSVRFYL